MTTPQQIDGDIIDPDQWTGRMHPAIIDPTMTERKRCLIWAYAIMELVPANKRPAIREIIARIESGEQP